MPQPATLIDAPATTTVRHGSQAVMFNFAGVLVAEDINYNKGTRAIDQNDEMGKALKSAYVSTKGTGSMTVQLKNATTKIIMGEVATFLDTDGSTSIATIVTEVGIVFQQNDATKVKINIAEKLN